MFKTAIQRIVATVRRRARQQGFICPEEVRDLLTRAGLPDRQWLDVVSLAGDMLRNEDGCFYYLSDPRNRTLRGQRQLRRTVRHLIRGYKSSVQDERRRQGRIDFVQPVQVETEDGRAFTLLSCDLSPSGIRLVAAFSLLGKKIRITLPKTRGSTEHCVCVQVVWSSLIGDGLYENGGAFLHVADSAGSESSKVTAGVRLPSMPAPLCEGSLPLSPADIRCPRPR